MVHTCIKVDREKKLSSVTSVRPRPVTLFKNKPCCCEIYNDCGSPESSLASLERCPFLLCMALDHFQIDELCF